MPTTERVGAESACHLFLSCCPASWKHQGLQKHGKVMPDVQVMDEIASREWGLLLLDEVHVVPAQMFRKV